MPIVSFEISSQSGTNISGWHIEAREKKGVVVLLHGIRANKLSMFERSQLLLDHGYSSILIDFQAHGESQGENITVGFLEKYDVIAAIDFAKTSHPNEPIGVIGVSMGGAAALLASPKDIIDALILESVYPDIRKAIHNRVRGKLGVLSWLPSELLLLQLEPRLGIEIKDLNPSTEISRVDCPILVISGTEDIHTTVEDTELLYKQANGIKQIWLAEGLKHEDIYAAIPETYTKEVIGFLDKHMN